MAGQKRTFGLVFAAAGALLLVAAGAFNRPPAWTIIPGDHPEPGRWTGRFYEVDALASDLAGCAGWAGAISLALGFAFLAAQMNSLPRRRSLSARPGKTH